MTSFGIIQSGGGRSRITVSGSFTHPHWLAFLGSGLAQRGVSIVSGSVVRNPQRVWTGELEVDTSSSPRPLRPQDLVVLASTRAQPSTAPPRLTGWSVSRRTDGLLDVQFSANDEIGLLGRLLSRLAVLTLLPYEAELCTVGGMATDRIVLGGVAGAVPSAEVELSLRALLGGLEASAAVGG